MKYFLIIILFTLSTFASERASKDDIKKLKNDMRNSFSELRKDMRENNKMLLEVIKANQEATNKRFEAVDKRFEDMNSKFNMIVTIMLAGFALIMGYLIKERNSIKKDIKVELEEELNKKADVNLVERVVSVLEEFGKKNSDIAEVLKKHNFIVK